MQENSRHIIFTGLAIGGISIVYFVALICKLPFLITVLLTAASLFFIYRWLYRESPIQEENRKWTIVLLAAGLLIIVNKTYEIAEPHGQWDAWAIWNLHSKYLANGDNWKNMFHNTVEGHPDYPLALPATVAFFSRLAGGFHQLIPFVLHFLIMLCIPVIIFTETYKKSIIVAGLALLYLATDDFYITQAISQQADTLLAFFFLSAFITFEYGKTNRKYLIISSAFLALCAWTKNEGIMLALIFVLFNIKTFVTEWKYALYGIMFPLAALLIFKIVYAPANDLVLGQSQQTLQNFFNGQRYSLVYDSLVKNLDLYFKKLKYLVILYLIYCLIRKKLPDRRLIIVLTCLLAYFVVYLLSPQDLEWHLFTSQSRLLHQLMPVTVYIFATKFAGTGGTNVISQLRVFSVRRLPR